MKKNIFFALARHPLVKVFMFDGHGAVCWWLPSFEGHKTIPKTAGMVYKASQRFQRVTWTQPAPAEGGEPGGTRGGGPVVFNAFRR